MFEPLIIHCRVFYSQFSCTEILVLIDIYELIGRLFDFRPTTFSFRCTSRIICSSPTAFLRDLAPEAPPASVRHHPRAFRKRIASMSVIKLGILSILFVAPILALILALLLALLPRLDFFLNSLRYFTLHCFHVILDSWYPTSFGPERRDCTRGSRISHPGENLAGKLKIESTSKICPFHFGEVHRGHICATFAHELQMFVIQPVLFVGVEASSERPPSTKIAPVLC